MRTTRFLEAAATLSLAAILGCGSIIDPEAQKQFLAAVGDTSVVVFPACVRAKEATYDHDAATTLAAHFNETGFATATVATEEPFLAAEWQMNQAKMWRQSAQSFAEYIQEHPIDADYALIPEFLIGGGGGVGGIHCYVVDRQGRLAEGLLLNSHHQAFSSASPKTVEDCTQVLQNVIDDAWKKE